MTLFGCRLRAGLRRRLGRVVVAVTLLVVPALRILGRLAVRARVPVQSYWYGCAVVVAAAVVPAAVVRIAVATAVAVAPAARPVTAVAPAAAVAAVAVAAVAVATVAVAVAVATPVTVAVAALTVTVALALGGDRRVERDALRRDCHALLRRRRPAVGDRHSGDGQGAEHQRSPGREYRKPTHAHPPGSVLSKDGAACPPALAAGAGAGWAPASGVGWADWPGAGWVCCAWHFGSAGGAPRNPRHCSSKGGPHG